MELSRTLTSPMLALFITLVFSAAAFSGRFSVTATKFLLVVAFLVAAVGVFEVPRMRSPWWLGVVVLLVVGAALVVFGRWLGDPVRGPFAKLAQPRSTDTFEYHSGVTIGYPVAALKDWIDFSRAVQLPGNPIRVQLRRRWLHRIEYRVEVSNGIKISNDSITGLPAGWDVNSDDNAVEIVNAERLPVVQIIQASGYDVYVNLVLRWPNGNVMIMNGESLLDNWPAEKLTPAQYPAPLFKYPSYAHRGARL